MEVTCVLLPESDPLQKGPMGPSAQPTRLPGSRAAMVPPLSGSWCPVGAGWLLTEDGLPQEHTRIRGLSRAVVGRRAGSGRPSNIPA